MKFYSHKSMRYCFFLCSIPFLLFAVGCKENTVTPTSNAMGNVSGYVRLYDFNGKALSSSYGVTVSVIGSEKTAQTNDSGKWTLKNLPAGSYTFMFNNEGFGTMKVFDFKVTPNDSAIFDEVDMSEPSREIINFQEFRVSISDSIPSYYVIAAMPQPYLDTRSVVLCISTDSAALTHDPASALILLPFVTSGSGYDGGFLWNSTNALSVHADTIAHGKKFYVTLCVSGKGSNAEYLSNYYDPTLNKVVYTALAPHSQILNAIMP